MSSRDRGGSVPQALAGLLVVWSVAWSVPLGRISEDTKNDLYVDPWGFLGRALHLWDPQVTWGGLQNQAFGYLFPMGPFFGVGSEILPMWVVQRLWWMALLTAGFLAMLGLLRALGIGGAWVRVVSALAYVLAPRVLSTLGGLSSEAQPQLLAPAILLPLVLVDRGRLGVRRGAALSAAAVLCCGGVNATATAFAVVPAALWLLTRRTWWRQSLTWSWGLLVLSATSWWLVPLLYLGRYSPPFLDWIENAQTVTAQVTLFDVLRGTTHWLGHLVTSAGEWWPAGFQLVSSRGAILATAAVMTLGLAGITLRRLPHRTFLVVCLALGVLVIALPHSGPLDSPLSGPVQDALDGPLAPLRNVHKADLLIRLPLAVGLAHLLASLSTWRPRQDWLRGAAFSAVLLLVLGAAAPGFSGSIAPRGSFDEIASHWRDVGRWLDGRDDGTALIVPAASFGEYTWGRPMDEPLRPLTSAAYAVRDAVPLAPAGTIRFLDEVEARLQTGRSISGATSALRSAGVRYFVLRNDLAAGEAGQPPVALARSALVNTPDAVFVKGFGKTWLDATGTRVFPVEVFALNGTVAPPLEVWDADELLGASGASEDLPRLADAGLGRRPVVFDGDRSEGVDPGSTVVTDGYRARDRWFGAPRGQDVTSGLDLGDATRSSDYFSWPEVERRSLVSSTGIRAVRASTSIAQDFGAAGLQPAHRPFAALDGNPRTSWATAFDADPTLTVDLGTATDVRQLRVQPFVDRVRFGQGLGIATDVTVTTDRGVVDARLDTTGESTTIVLPEGATRTLSLRILDTTAGRPGQVVTGLAEISIPGLVPTEVVTTPATTEAVADTVVLGAGLSGRDGCSLLLRRFTCYSGLLLDPESTGSLAREVSGLAAGERRLSGTLAVDPLQPPEDLLTVPGVEVTASSLRGYAPAGLPVGVVDSDPRTAWSPSPDDTSPSLTITFDRPTTIDGIQLQTRGSWARKEAPAVVIDVDGATVTRRLPEHGGLPITPTTGRRVTLTFVGVPGRGRPGLGALELEEVEVVGHRFTPPAAELRSGCGEGPLVTVDGRPVPTQAAGPRSALFGIGDFTWQACEPFSLTSAPTHSFVVGPWRDLAPRSAVAAPVDPRPVVAADAVSHDRVSPTLLRAQLAAGPQRVVVMSDNANPGWRASLDGSPLTSQVVDGRRQGFVVPDGAAGRLTVEFAPDVQFRRGLVLGTLLAAVVVLLALWPGRGRPRVGPLPDVTPPRSARLLVPVAWSTVIAGPVGLLVGGLAVVTARVLRARALLPAAIVLVLGMSAAVVQAWTAPGLVGSSVVEGAVRLLVLGAFAVALASQEPPGED